MFQCITNNYILTCTLEIFNWIDKNKKYIKKCIKNDRAILLYSVLTMAPHLFYLFVYLIRFQFIYSFKSLNIVFNFFSIFKYKIY